MEVFVPYAILFRIVKINNGEYEMTITDTIKELRELLKKAKTQRDCWDLNDMETVIHCIPTILDAAEKAERLSLLLAKANYTYLGWEYVACLEPAAIQEALAPEQPEGEK